MCATGTFLLVLVYLLEEQVKNYSFSIHIFKWKDLKENFCLLLINTSQLFKKEFGVVSARVQCKGVENNKRGNFFFSCLVSVSSSPLNPGWFPPEFPPDDSCAFLSSVRKPFLDIGTLASHAVLSFERPSYRRSIETAFDVANLFFLHNCSLTLLYTLSSQPLHFIITDYKAFVNVTHSLVKRDGQL